MKHRKHNASDKPFFRAALKADGTLEILIYEEIGEDYWSHDGGVTAKTIRQKMDDAGNFSKIVIRINSPGGNAFEGIAIHNVVRAQKKPVEVYVDGIAASSASIIAMCGDTITMGHNAMMMVHNAWSLCAGEAAEMRKMADTLDRVSGSIAQTYVDRTGKSLDEIKAMMDAETWLSADECVEQGFATAIAESDPVGAQALAKGFRALARFKKTPDNLKATEVHNDDSACDCSCQPCVDGYCSACEHEGCVDPNCVNCPMRDEAASASGKTPAASAVEPPPADKPEESNLSLYEARMSMLRRQA